jgi:hypothetical protein
LGAYGSLAAKKNEKRKKLEDGEEACRRLKKRSNA